MEMMLVTRELLRMETVGRYETIFIRKRRRPMLAPCLYETCTRTQRRNKVHIAAAIALSYLLGFALEFFRALAIVLQFDYI